HLRTKLVLATMAMLVAICCVVGVISYASMDSFLTGQLDTQLSQASRRASAFGGPPPNSSGTRPDPLEARGQGAGTLNARLSDGTADVAGLIGQDGRRHTLQPADIELLTPLPQTTAPAVPAPTDRTLSVGAYRLVSVKTAYGDVIVTGLPLAAKQSTLNSLVLTSVLVSLTGLLLVGLLGTMIIRRTLKPLEALSGVATKVSKLPLDAGEVALAVRVPPQASRPGTEVGNVGHALNKMLDNVAGALSARQQSEMKVRRFVADATHELRTPLSALRGYTEMLTLTETFTPDGEKSLERIRSQSLRMGRLVEDLLTLARLDEGQPLKLGPVGLSQLLVEAVADQKVISSEHRWVLQLPEEPVEVTADGARIHQVLVNLLSNARKHTDPGTTITAAVARPASGGAVLTVTDDGPGVPPELQQTVFSRFTRADQARTGTDGTTGLGLSIVQAIVAAHGGSVELSSRPGRTEFAVHLPGRGRSGDAASP
ncbi:HAMP domain-containing histidine kinase, partial [Arthrobacter deserti]|nr:HAMP domain-containing histidine kinase [Arthrobacter deserti]